MNLPPLVTKIGRVIFVPGLILIGLILIATFFASLQNRDTMMNGAWNTEEDTVSASSNSSFFGSMQRMMNSFDDTSFTNDEYPLETSGMERVIKTGYIDMTSTDVRATVAKISSLAQDRAGFVQSSSTDDDVSGRASANISIRVPNYAFEETIRDIKALGAHVNSETISGNDVTDQYIDLTARLSAAEAQEEQYLTILRQANTVGEILAVQEHLGTVRSEIEALQGQVNYLENLTDLSTITVSISEELSAASASASKFDPLRDMNAAFAFVVTLSQYMLSFLIWAVILGIAIGIPVGIIWLMVRFIINRGNRKGRK